MKVVADIQIIPLGVGLSLSRYIADCEKILSEAGLNPQLHAHGSNVEGDWDTVMKAVRKCHEAVHELGAPRISTAVKISTRIDRDDTLQGRVKSVQEKT